MADLKISQLNSIVTVVPSTDVLPVVQGGTTYKVTPNQLLGAGGTATLASATITGDLTVDTSTLKVDSTNNRVGIGTATPGETLHVSGGSSDGVIKVSNTSSGNGYLIARTTGELDVFNAANASIRFSTNGTLQATLNSTGLGIGASPIASSRLSSKSSATQPYNLALQNRNATQSWYVYVDAAAVDDKLFTINDGTANRLIIDTSGNVGVGVTPSAWRTSVPFRALQIGYTGAVYGITTSEQVNLSSNYLQDTGGNEVRIQAGFATRYQQSSGQHLWSTAATSTAGSGITFTQAMTLTAAGKLNIGNASGDVGLLYVRKDSLTDQVVQIGNEAATGKMITFHTNGNNQVGSISFTNSAVAYNTSSDYRLKESVKSISGGLARVNALKPSAYKWKVDGSAGEGFLAHELAEVVPAAVSGEKDAVNEDGTIKSQGIDMSRIVPILVAAIQELTAEVNALKNA